MQEWANDIHLGKGDRAKLDQKIDMLAQAGPNLPPGLLSGVPKYGHIRKLRVRGSVQLRPLLCFGPFDMNEEFTFLLGAVERDWKLRPHNAIERANENREELIAAPTRREEHESLS